MWEALVEGKGRSFRMNNTDPLDLSPEHVISQAGVHGIHLLLELTVGAQESKKSPHLTPYRVGALVVNLYRIE